MAVQALAQANVIVGSTRVVKFVVVFNGNVAIGSPIALYGAAGGSGAFGTAADVQVAVVYSDVFMVDGVFVKRLDAATGSVTTFTASVGTVPPKCRLVCNWRGRLVLARQDVAPHLWFMSKLGDPTDWEFAGYAADSAQAGNNTRAGTIGDAITALMPAGDDVLYFGGDHSIWRMVGDPGDGGQILPVSEAVGVVGPNAWCQDPTGSIYFVSSQGLHRLPPGGGISSISAGRIDGYFDDIDKAGQRVTLVWDRDNKGLWIFRQETVGPSIHLFWDRDTDSFWPMRFDNPDMKPRAAMSYDGDAPGDRRLCVGGDSDKVYNLVDPGLTDAGTAIDSYVYIGPVQPFGLLDEAKANRLDATMGAYANRISLPLTVNWTLLAAEDPYAVMSAPVETATGSWPTTGSVGRQDTQCLSMRGRTFMLKLSHSATGSTWAYERAAVVFRTAGRVR